MDDIVRRDVAPFAADDVATLTDYWLAQLEGVPALLQICLDHARPLEKQSSLWTSAVPISEATQAGISRFCDSAKIETAEAVFAAFLTFLYRYSGDEDFVVGHIDNRQKYAAATSNTVLPIRSEINPQTPFNILTRQVQSKMRLEGEHAGISISALVNALGIETHSSHHPLFQVGFFVHTHNGGVPAKTSASWRAADKKYGSLDLALEITLTNKGFHLQIAYDQQVFDATTVKRMGEIFTVLLQDAADHPNTAVGSLNILSQDEKRKILEEWNATETDYPDKQCLHDLIELRAKQTPDAVAIVCDSNTLSYAALDRRANALAHRLQKEGVRANVPVGLFLERSLEMVVAILGTLKAGGAYLPLDPDLPDDRLASIIDDAGANAVLTSNVLRPRLAGRCTSLISLDGDIAETDAAPANDAGPETLCYVLYTSGSTGTPKGVMIPHRAICNHMAWMIDQYGYGADDHVLQKTPFGFDASVWEFFAPLLTGAKLVMARPGGHRDMAYMIREINANKITTLQLVPSVLKILIEDPSFPSCNSLRRLFCGGEALPTKLATRVHELLDVEVHNLYGPTETCIDATSEICTTDIEQEIVPIGHPIWNTQAYILDGNRQPVPIGVPGELYIAGAGLAHGYVNRPELTAEKFVPSSFVKSPAGRMYRTGDRVRYLADGRIDFLGRIDFQVKFHGYRIELGEIETVLEKHDAVRQAVVLKREDIPGRPLLVGYITPTEGRPLPDADDLRIYLEGFLPTYMVPSAIVGLETLPLTTSGKVDRRSLLKPAADDATPDREAKAAETPTEIALVKIWSEIFNGVEIGTADDFFQLGGDSLDAMRLALLVREALDRELALHQIFEAPTIRELAEFLDNSTDMDTAIPPVRSHGNSGPASFAQESFWTAAQAYRNQPVFNQIEIARFRQPLNKAAFNYAIQEVVERHESLRTVLVLKDDMLVQVVTAPEDIAFSPPELEQVEVADLAEICRSSVQQPIDLQTAPVFRTRLLCASEDDHTLILVLPHAMWDGWSADILMRDLLFLYEGYLSGEEHKLPPTPLRYIDYAVRQRERSDAGDFEPDIDFWQKTLDSNPPKLTLPTDKKRRAIARWWGARETITVSASIKDRLKELAADRGATFYMTLLAAFEILMHRITGETDIIIGASTAGRSMPGTDQIVGCLINFLPLRTMLDAEGSFIKHLGRVRRTSLDAFAHQDLPLGKAMEPLIPKDRFVAGLALPVWFELHDGRDNWEATYKHLGVERVDIGRGICEAELVVEMTENNDNLVCHFEYMTTVFDAERIQGIARSFLDILDSVAANPEQTISRIDIPNLATAD